MGLETEAGECRKDKDCDDEKVMAVIREKKGDIEKQKKEVAETYKHFEEMCRQAITVRDFLEDHIPALAKLWMLCEWQNVLVLALLAVVGVYWRTLGKRGGDLIGRLLGGGNGGVNGGGNGGNGREKGRSGTRRRNGHND